MDGVSHEQLLLAVAARVVGAELPVDGEGGQQGGVRHEKVTRHQASHCLTARTTPPHWLLQDVHNNSVKCLLKQIS